MELFLPGLLVLVIASIFIFLVVPRTGPMILAVISLVALLAAGVHHYSMFSSEYALSTWQYGLASYAPWVILGLALLFIISAISFFFAGSETKQAMMNKVATPMEAIQVAVQNSVAAMPAMPTTATNPLTGVLNRGLNMMVAPAAPTNQNQNRNRAQQQQSPPIPGVGFPASQF